MTLPLRQLRMRSDELTGRLHQLAPRDQTIRDLVLAHAPTLIAEFGRAAVTLPALATGLAIPLAALRRQFLDIDMLISEIIRVHLRDLSLALGEAAAGINDAAEAASARRTAWRRYTRTPTGAHTPSHIMLLRERHTLPQDLRDPIEETLEGLTPLLAGPASPLAALHLLDLLDSPTLPDRAVEAQFAHAQATLGPANNNTAENTAKLSNSGSTAGASTTPQTMPESRLRPLLPGHRPPMDLHTPPRRAQPP